MDGIDIARRLRDRIAELKKQRASKGDTRESFPIAYNQLRDLDDNNERLVHIIVPTPDGDQVIVKRYFKGTAAEIVRRISEIYPIPDIDSDHEDNTDIGEYGIFKIEEVANDELRYSSNDIEQILDYIFRNVLCEEIKKNGGFIKKHNFYDIIKGIRNKFKVPIGNIKKRYGTKRAQ